MLQNYWPHVVQTTMERRTCVIFNVFDCWKGHVIKESYICDRLIWNLWNLCNFGIFACWRLTKYRNYTTRLINFILNDHSCKILYRAYPENASFKTCPPSTLKFHVLWPPPNKEMLKCELDILNSSGVIATQKYIEHIMKCWECTYEGKNEQFSHSLSYWVTVLNNA